MNRVTPNLEQRPSENDATTRVHGLRGLSHFKAQAMVGCHDIRKAIDLVRLEATSFVDDENRPRSAVGRRRVMSHVDARIVAVLGAVAAVERMLDQMAPCILDVMRESRQTGHAVGLDAAAEG